MFTIEQIKTAHSKVKSGADFPAYIQDIKQLGVTAYESYVTDGHTDYYGNEDYQVTLPARFEPMEIAAQCQAEQFKTDLREHQQGKTDFPTFRINCAHSGIEKWSVRMDNMTCTYYDKVGHEILVEQIPQ